MIKRPFTTIDHLKLEFEDETCETEYNILKTKYMDCLYNIKECEYNKIILFLKYTCYSELNIEYFEKMKRNVILNYIMEKRDIKQIGMSFREIAGKKEYLFALLRVYLKNYKKIEYCKVLLQVAKERQYFCREYYKYKKEYKRKKKDYRSILHKYLA